MWTLCFKLELLEICENYNVYFPCYYWYYISLNPSIGVTFCFIKLIYIRCHFFNYYFYFLILWTCFYFHLFKLPSTSIGPSCLLISQGLDSYLFYASRILKLKIESLGYQTTYLPYSMTIWAFWSNHKTYTKIEHFFYIVICWLTCDWKECFWWEM